MSLTLDTFRPAAIVATDVCVDLALGRPEALAYFDAAPIDIRLATATYLELLEGCRNPEEQRRIKRFVQGYAVLSLGPMASSNAVQLLLEHSLSDGLTAVQALAAATALAHEIPLVTARPEPYQGIAGLEILTPYAL